MAITSNPEKHQSTTEKVCMDDVASNDLADSNRSCQELSEIDVEPGSLKCMEFSTECSEKDLVLLTVYKKALRIASEKMLGPSSNKQADIAKSTLDVRLMAICEKALHITESLLKDISSKTGSVYIENIIMASLRSFYGKPFPEETVSSDVFPEEDESSDVVLSFLPEETVSSDVFPEEAESSDVVLSFLPEETGSIGKIPVSSSSENSKDAEKTQSSSSVTELDETALSGTVNICQKNEILPESFSENPFDLPVSKIDDTSIFAAESIKISDFQQDGEKSMERETSPSSAGAIPKAFCDGRVISIPCKSIFPTFDMPPVSIPKTTELPESLYQEIKKPILIDMNSNISLIEFLSILENWGRNRLDIAFNIPIADFRTHFAKDLRHGLEMMKQMTTRVCTLMTAVNHLPDPDLGRFTRGRNRVRGDLISAGIKIRQMINNTELSAIQAIHYLKQVSNSNDIIINSYTKVTDNLSLLRKEIEDFHDKIRVFCSELEKLQ